MADRTPPPFPILSSRGYWMMYRGPGFLAGVWSGFPPPPSHPTPSRVSKLSLFLSLPVCRRSGKGEGGGGGARSQDEEKAWSSINNFNTLSFTYSLTHPVFFSIPSLLSFYFPFTIFFFTVFKRYFILKYHVGEKIKVLTFSFLDHEKWSCDVLFTKSLNCTDPVQNIFNFI